MEILAGPVGLLLNQSTFSKQVVSSFNQVSTLFFEIHSGNIPLADIIKIESSPCQYSIYQRRLFIEDFRNESGNFGNSLES